MFCDEVYTPGHHLKHKKSHVFLMDGDEEGSGDEEESLESEEEAAPEASDKTPTVSINALNGSASFSCMRFVGYYGEKKHQIHILIDPGSTHNFLDLKRAQEIGCPLTPINPMTVAAAGGDLVAGFKSTGFKWSVQGYDFQTEVKTLPLDCCDLVLGVQWLSTLGPIL